MLFLLLPLIANGVLSGFSYKLNNRPPLITIFSSTFFGLIIMLIAFGVNFFVTDDPFANLTWEAFGWVALRGAMYPVLVFLWTKGIKHVPMSIADPFTLSRMLFLLVFSQLIWGDAVSGGEIALVAAIFAACAVMGVLQNRTEKANSNSKQYLIGLMWLFVWTSCATGATIVTRAAAETGVDVVTYSVLENAVAFVIVCVLFVIFRRPFGSTIKSITRDKIQYGIGISDNIWIFFYWPLALVMNLGVLDAIQTASTILVIICGVVFLKEKIRWYIYPLMAVIIGCGVALALISA